MVVWCWPLRSAERDLRGADAVDFTGADLAFAHPFFIKPVIGIRFMPYARQWVSVSVVFVGLMLLVNHFNLFVMPEWFEGWL